MIITIITIITIIIITIISIILFINKFIVQIGLLGAGIVAMFQLVGLNKLIGLIPLAYGDYDDDDDDDDDPLNII